jgi:diguanylate cyclase (GGDEF)-like protein
MPDNMNRRILVIDDDKSIHEAYRAIFEDAGPQKSSIDDLEAAIFGTTAVRTGASCFYQKKFDVTFASQGKEGLELLKKAAADGRPFAAAFVDMRMPPGWDGLETIQHLWEADADLEVVVCTAHSDRSWEEVIERLGRTSKLLLLRKPFERAEIWQLACALTEKRSLEESARQKLEDAKFANMRLTEEINARSRAETELIHRALHDGLTDLPNRISLLDRLNYCLARSKRDEDYKFAVLFLDLDDFKIVNDSLGHSIGDHLLIQIAERMRECVRSIDVTTRPSESLPARLGGDEFVILLDGIKEQNDAVKVAQRLSTSVSRVFVIAGHEIHVTFSVGIAFSRKDYELPEEILRDADAALYHAKAEGKARIGIFDDAIRQQVLSRLKLGNDLRHALARQEFRLRYQPIYRLVENRIESFESLIRWQHPELGLIAPNDFIPIGEECGLIGEIGHWALLESCRQIRIWRDQFPEYEHLSISVNTSARQLADPEYSKRLDQILEQTGVEGRYVNIELTESAVFKHSAEQKRSIEHLQKRGLKLHLDDFGTGYSSLLCLRSLPFDAIKIDREFVHDMERNGWNGDIVWAIQMMAATRNMMVIAEGIERAEQLERLCQLRCEYGQGFHLSPPVDAKTATGLLAKAKRPITV